MMMKRNIRCHTCKEHPCNHWACPYTDPVADILLTYGCIDCEGIYDIDENNEYGSWTYICITCKTQYIHDPRRKVEGIRLLNLIVKKPEGET